MVRSTVICGVMLACCPSNVSDLQGPDAEIGILKVVEDP